MRCRWALDPDARAQGLVDGAGGVADGGLDVLPLVVAQLGEVAALGAKDPGTGMTVSGSGRGGSV